MAKKRNGGRTSRGYYEDYGVISISKRALAIVLCVVVLLLGAGAAVFCWGARDENGHWAKNPTITEWFNYWGKGAPEGEDETQETVIQQEQGLFVLTTRNVAAAPVALHSAQAQADTNTATITAKVSPANADYSAVNWTSSDSAVQLTPNEENPLRVHVALVGELNRTATITCEVVSVTTLTGTCTVDYISFPAGMTATCEKLKFGAENDITIFVDGFVGGTLSDFNSVITYAEVELTSETVTAITSRLGINAGWDMAGGSIKDGKFVLAETPYDTFCDSAESITAENFRKAFFAVCNGKDNCAQLYINIDLVYNGKTYKSYECYSEAGFDGSTYGVPANGVQIGDGVILTD